MGLVGDIWGGIKSAPHDLAVGAEHLGSAAYNWGKPAQVDTGNLVRLQDRAFGTQDYYRGMQDPTRGNTLFNEGQTLIGNLTNAANGAVPSAAEIQARQQAQQGAAQMAGRASAFQGRDPAAALRMATLGAGDLEANAIANGAALRAKEQADARGQLVTAVGGATNAENDRQRGYITGDIGGLDAAARAAQAKADTDAKNSAAQQSFKGGLVSAGTKIIGSIFG